MSSKINPNELPRSINNSWTFSDTTSLWVINSLASNCAYSKLSLANNKTQLSITHHHGFQHLSCNWWQDLLIIILSNISIYPWQLLLVGPKQDTQCNVDILQVCSITNNNKSSVLTNIPTLSCHTLHIIQPHNNITLHVTGSGKTGFICTATKILLSACERCFHRSVLVNKSLLFWLHFKAYQHAIF